MNSQLARELRLRDYFSLAFGAMIGVGWLVLMDDWLARGGPFGAMLAFAIGGLLLLPIGYVYGEWVKRLPDAAGEAAYTAQVFSPIVSYFTGWIMLLAYFIVCPWEAVAIGKIAGMGGSRAGVRFGAGVGRAGPGLLLATVRRLRPPAPSALYPDAVRQ